jgi:predicted transcriptional regulator
VTEHRRALLLSVRPRFAESIITGAKSAEIRRQRPGAQLGTPVVIYATLPIAAVIGTARIAGITAGTPADLWARHHAQVGVSREEFDAYLQGAATAYILLLAESQRLSTPLTLRHLRATADFQPPRSFQYLTRDKLHELVDDHPGGGPLLDLLPADRAT